MEAARDRLAAAEEAMANAPPQVKERLLAQVEEARQHIASLRDATTSPDASTRSANSTTEDTTESEANLSKPAAAANGPAYVTTAPYKRARIAADSVNDVPQITRTSPTPVSEPHSDHSALMALAEASSMFERLPERPKQVKGDINARPKGPTVEQQGKAALALPAVLRYGAAKYVDACMAVINSVPEEVYAATNGILAGKQNNVNIMVKEMVKSLIQIKSKRQPPELIHNAHYYLSELLQAPLTKAFDIKAKAESRGTLLALSMEAAKGLSAINLSGILDLEKMIDKQKNEAQERELIEKTMVLQG